MRSAWEGEVISVTTPMPGFAHLGQDFQALLLQPLEGIGRGARLERPAAEERRAGPLDLAGDGERLLPALDGARPGDNGDVLAADDHVPHPHAGVLGVHLTADQLERGLDPQDPGDTGQTADLLLAAAGLAQDADALALLRRQLAAVAAVRLEFQDQVGLGLGGQIFFEFDDHDAFSPLS